MTARQVVLEFIGIRAASLDAVVFVRVGGGELDVDGRLVLSRVQSV